MSLIQEIQLKKIVFFDVPNQNKRDKIKYKIYNINKLKKEFNDDSINKNIKNEKILLEIGNLYYFTKSFVKNL